MRGLKEMKLSDEAEDRMMKDVENALKKEKEALNKINNGLTEGQKKLLERHRQLEKSSQEPSKKFMPETANRLLSFWTKVAAKLKSQREGLAL
jgi:hypothetical protein